MKNSQTTKDGSPKITVIFVSEDDLAIERGLDVIQELSSYGEVANFILEKVSESSSVTSMLENGEETRVQLFGEIARFENLSRIDLIAIGSSLLPAESQARLVNSLSQCKLDLEVLAAGNKTEIKDHRIYFPQYQELGDVENFFTGNASSRLVVLPTDKASDLAVAQPVYFRDLESTFQWHVASEVLSICGLWISQVGAAIEEIQQPPTGSFSQPLQLVRSFARTAQTSLEEIGSDGDSFFSENLAVPPSKVPAPDPFFVAQYTSEIIHHKNFRLQPEEPMESGKSTDGIDLIKQVMKRVWKDFLTLPSMIRHGIESQLDTATAETAQQIVGEDSWVQAAVEVHDEGNEENLSDDQIQLAIDTLEKQSEKPTNVAMYGSEWKQVLEYSLGIIDGADQVAELRQSAGNERWVNVEVQALAPVFSDDISVVAEKLGIRDLNKSSSGIKSTSAGDNSLLSLVSKKFQDQAEEANRRLRNTMQDLRTLSRPESVENEMASKTVQALFISTFFLFLFVLAAFSPIQIWLDTDWSGQTRVIAALIPTGILLLPIALLFSPVESKARQNFVLFSTVLIFSLVIFGGIFSEKFNEVPKWIAPIVITIGIAAAIQRGWRVHTGEGGDDKWHRLALKTCVVLLPIYILVGSVFTLNTEPYEPSARSINDITYEELTEPESEGFQGLVEDQASLDENQSCGQDPFLNVENPRQSFETMKEVNSINRLCRVPEDGVTSSPYDQWKDLKNSLEGDYFDENRTWLWVSLPLLFVLFATSGLILSVARQREENIFNDWRNRFLWLVQEAKVHARERRLCANYRVQWLGTALVLARLIHYPHGKASSSDQTLISNIRSIPATQKLRTISLQPTPYGAGIFKEIATAKISEPGWLTNQYYKMSRAFLRKETGHTGDQFDTSVTLPELCPYPVSLNEALDGDANGRRWPFCYQVYEGAFDADLRLAVTEKLTEALLETYLKHTNSYEALGNESGDSLGKLFGDLIPLEEQIWAPAIFGSGVAANFQGGSKNMTSNIWWPNDMVQAPVEQEESWRKIHTATTSATETSIFSQVIRVDVSDVIKVSDLSGQALTSETFVHRTILGPTAITDSDTDPDKGTKPQIG